MRKFVAVLLLVTIFAAGISVGFMTPNAEAKKEKCWYVCDGEVTMKCCRQGPRVVCWVYVLGCIQ